MPTRPPGRLKSAALTAAALLAFFFAGVDARAQEDIAEEATEKIISQKAPAQTLQDALSAAYRNNPTLQAARAELRATRELLPQAGAGWKPTIGAETSITASEIEGSNFGGVAGDIEGDGSTAKDVIVSLEQPIFRGGRTFAEVAAARRVISAQEALVRVQEQDIMLAAATAYMDVLRDLALVRLSENNRDVIARQLEATRQRFEVGELTRTDVSQAEARLAEADSLTITAQGNLRTSMAAYEQVIGSRPQDLEPPDVTFTLPETLDEAVSAADQYNPQVQAAIFTHEAAKKDINSVFGELLPEVGFFGSYNKTYDPSPGLIEEQETQAVGLSASIPLYEAGATRSRLRQAKHTANQRYLEILEARRLVRQEATRNWENLQTARAEIRARTAQAEAAKIAQQGVRAETELGARTVLDALDADQEALDAQVALVTAERDELVATFALLATLGALTPENLGFRGDSTFAAPE